MAASPPVPPLRKTVQGCETPSPTPPVPGQPATGEKENRFPVSQPRPSLAGRRTPLAARTPTGSASEERQLQAKLFTELETAREENRQKRNEAKELRQQVASKDRRLDELQRKLEDALADKRTMHKAAMDAETERDAKRRQLHEKEQELAALMRKSEQLRGIAEERSRRIERQEEEHLRAPAAAAAERQTAHQARLQAETQAARLEERLQGEIARRSKLEAALREGELNGLRIEERLRESEASSLRAEERLRESEASCLRAEARAKALEEELGRTAAGFEEARQQNLEESEALRKSHGQLEEQLAAERKRSRAGADDGDAAARAAEGWREGREAGQRAKQAEERAEAASDELRRWREWADEQQLREVTAEAERIEELKRVRADVTRQVESARQELVDENRLLQKRLRDAEPAAAKAADSERRVEALEAELAGARRELDAAEASLEALRQERAEEASRAEEQRRTLDVRATKAEALAEEAACELSEERERLEARTRAFRVECDVAVAARGEEFERDRSVEREAFARREAGLEEALAREQDSNRARRWQALALAVLHARSASESQAAITSSRQAAGRWRQRAARQDADEERHRRQAQALERLEDEFQDLRAQHRELIASHHVAQQELVIATAEAQRLQGIEDTYEREVLRISEKNAELGGHANPKQKIKHLMSLKADNVSMRQELKRVKQQLAQTEAQLRLVTDGGELSVFSRRGGAARRLPTTPGPPAPTTPRTPSPKDAFLDDDGHASGSEACAEVAAKAGELCVEAAGGCAASPEPEDEASLALG